MSYNRFYHSYFENYTEKEVYDPRRKRLHIERTYAGYYYRQNCADKTWKQYKVRYLLTALVAAFALILQGTAESAREWYIVLPIVAGILALAWFAVYTAFYVFYPRLLEIRQYKDRNTLIGAAAASMACCMAAAVGNITWIFLNRSPDIHDIAAVGIDFLAAALLFYVFRKENTMQYIKIKNNSKIDNDSYDIRVRNEE
ncbi:MAG: hypothetical protein LKJ76_03865 [Lachnospiraceae bacterium]|jgi:ABC-type transport system involved in cytochrome c biogenesis permease subunit|nr:hypothetical protein [Lachnospiraceae bacterium]